MNKDAMLWEIFIIFEINQKIVIEDHFALKIIY